ncbi:MAG TPA: D-aminoacyl-tRNA deacylase [Flexilinea sp.]|jgi:D-tyrosyl-tRNA(Tyr) deacylase|nr:D-tyrosyl-tRNA(Tyr) deacylase [Flexilinea sp.]OQA28454.1 MAG: D-tyrosyl-tRNA(Tyr) deacylase [Chloroflexi bacterium ADurb.Bin344]HNY93114.1 D-aminoacyl-tRNA deacylase [Flexilinea sp.]HOG21422.1 D-aminoacyl-tRNA deacylase [Flexilinea sp.]HOG60280.1 D-aminoacyl-tRNA deacylase [Flexilinea sp.]
MKAVIQRVSRASVTVDGRLISRIGTGLLVLLGVEEGDTRENALAMAKKTAALRIFRDENDKMNLSVRDCAGEAIVVSQFTLCADTRKGNRPSFIGAAAPEIAAPLVDLFAESMREQGVPTQQGLFGADMKVELLNDGPVTILLEN